MQQDEIADSEEAVRMDRPDHFDWAGLIPWGILIGVVLFETTKSLWFGEDVAPGDKALFWVSVAQVIVIASGTVFAAIQYLAFQADKRVERTLKLLTDYDVVRYVGTSGTEMSVARAVPLVQAAVTSLAAFNAGLADFMAANDTPAARQYLIQSDAVVTVVNYFNYAEGLARRDLIDKEMFLESRSYVLTLIVGPVRTLLAAEGRPYDLSDLEAFAREAQAYLEQHPIA